MDSNVMHLIVTKSQPIVRLTPHGHVICCSPSDYLSEVQIPTGVGFLQIARRPQDPNRFVHEESAPSGQEAMEVEVTGVEPGVTPDSAYLLHLQSQGVSHDDIEAGTKVIKIEKDDAQEVKVKTSPQERGESPGLTIPLTFKKQPWGSAKKKGTAEGNDDNEVKTDVRGEAGQETEDKKGKDEEKSDVTQEVDQEAEAKKKPEDEVKSDTKNEALKKSDAASSSESSRSSTPAVFSEAPASPSSSEQPASFSPLPVPILRTQMMPLTSTPASPASVDRGVALPMDIPWTPLSMVRLHSLFTHRVAAQFQNRCYDCFMILLTDRSLWYSRWDNSLRHA